MFDIILDPLAQAAAQFPDRTAFSDGTFGLSWRQCAQLAAAGGAYLTDHGFGFQPAGAVMECTPASLPAVFGAAAAGCRCLTADAGMPAAQMIQTLQTAGCRCVICDAAAMRHAPAFRKHGIYPVLRDEMFSGFLDADALRAAVRSISPDDPVLLQAYGGAAEGPGAGGERCREDSILSLTHRAVLTCAEQVAAAMNLTRDSALGLCAQFDTIMIAKAAVPAAALGMPVYAVPTSYLVQPLRLRSFLDRFGITTVCLGDTAVRVWLRECGSGGPMGDADDSTNINSAGTDQLVENAGADVPEPVTQRGRYSSAGQIELPALDGVRFFALTELPGLPTGCGDDEYGNGGSCSTAVSSTGTVKVGSAADPEKAGPSAPVHRYTPAPRF